MKTIDEEIRDVVERIEEADRHLHALQKRCLQMILVILLCIGCSYNPFLSQGYVYDRRVHPAWVETIPGYASTTCSRTRRSTTCHTIYDPPEFIEHPEEFELDISNCRHNVISSECKTNALYVSQDTYNAHPIGSYYGGE